MAIDSIIAKPTNKVLVMVAEASGCCASEVSAVATALPSASAGPMAPKLIVMPAMTIDATAIIVRLSTVSPFVVVVVHDSRFCRGCRLRLTDSRGGGDVHCRQDAEDVSLHHAGKLTEQRHDDREEERRNGQ